LNGRVLLYTKFEPLSTTCLSEDTTVSELEEWGKGMTTLQDILPKLGKHAGDLEVSKYFVAWPGQEKGHVLHEVEVRIPVDQTLHALFGQDAPIGVRHIHSRVGTIPPCSPLLTSTGSAPFFPKVFQRVDTFFIKPSIRLLYTRRPLQVRGCPSPREALAGNTTLGRL
jgi:hypothetical protein